ncbi:hypothetical protein HKO22_02820 [Peptoniphilus sp. AGMB00490]|uniref:Prophage tail endopeptidase domain-containing protein n=1 Tax=Peptoniphilus faecalis TaxID=2731255 RepID=A0A848RHE6_9FIRM|nr:phage tail protein [Peptoniphilus faecalis]NMW84676.1 hypothetical protein [Peptoniphilus faecalis]
MDISLKGVDFQKKMRLSLCKPDRKPFMEIHNINNLNRKISLVNVDELSFDVPLYRSTARGKKVRNELYDAIYGDFFIYLNDGKDDKEGQYFIIQNPEERKSESGEVVKSITAYSTEYTLSYKKVQKFDKEGSMLYDPNNSIDRDGVERGFLNYVENKTSWRVSYVAPKLLNKTRELKFSDTSILDAFKTCQEKFNCLFQYDTVKEEIRVITVDGEKNALGGNQGIVISDNNFVKSITKKINTDDIVTRLYMYGDDTISFQNYNVLGQNYVEDLSFYKDFHYMSKDLEDALDKYDKAVKDLTPTFIQIVKKLDKFNTELGRLDVLRQEKENAIKRLETLIDQNVSGLALPNSQYDNEDEIRAELTNKMHENQAKLKQERQNLLQIHSQIKKNTEYLIAANKEREDLKKQVDVSLFFTPDVLREYDRFIKESVVRDNSFKRTDENNLYEYAQEEIKRLCYPIISFDMDLDDFRKIARFKKPMARLKVGDLVNLESDDLDIKFEVRLLEMELDYSNEGIKLHFGNKFSTTDPTFYLSDLISNIQTASHQVALRDSEWNKSIEKYSTIARRLDMNLDLSKQAIVSAENQKPILDDRGLWLLKENPDGTIDNRQVRGVHNVIAFTNDNWETVGTAISGDGINAEAIRGRLGEFVTVNANQILITDQTEESQLADFVRANGGKTYRQKTPPDVKNGTVDSSIKIPDGALWLKSTNEDGSGKVVGIYRYNKDKTYSWTGIGSYSGTCHWQEVSDLVYKDKSYGGAKLSDNGLTTTSNGVRIDKDGITVSNTNSGTTVNTEMNAKGFYIKKDGREVFYVNAKGDLSIIAPNGEKIVVNTSGISMPATSRLKIGSSGTNYIDISSSGVIFGSNGFKYNTSNGTLTIGGNNGLMWNGSQLYIGGVPVSSMKDIERIYQALDSLARQLDNGRVPAYVQFG